MERYTGAEQIILLFDTYHCESYYLHESIKRAGYDCLAIVLEENDFLPEGVISVYELLSGDWKEEIHGRPRYFNEIEVPNCWSISAGVDEPYGKITYQHEEKGRIYYTVPKNRYLVKAVDWLDRKGNVCFRDHYDRFGNICARTFYGPEGQQLGKTWFTARGREILMENYVTGDLIYNDEALVKHFRTKLDLFCYCFCRLGFDQNRIFYNSLDMPFEISARLGGSRKKNLLFWQQTAEGGIQGNMQKILNGAAEHTRKVVVQKRAAYGRLAELGAVNDRLCRLGFIYPFQKENGHKAEALIYTDTDWIEHVKELIEAFPQMHFHIAAITVMSDRLKNLGRYPNVSLYPAVKSPVREELFERCDYYFDINHYAEIISAVDKAFMHNQLIFAFQETLHNRECVTEECIYPAGKAKQMIADVRTAMSDGKALEERLQSQRKAAMAETVKEYQNL